MKNRSSFYIIISMVLIISACSAGEKTADMQTKKEPEVFVFEDVDKIDTTKSVIDTSKTEMLDTVITVNETDENIDTIKLPEIQNIYIIQVGAFSSFERAQSFINTYQKNIEFELSVHQNDKTKLFVVQLQPFISRESAETVKNKIKQIPAFKDSFIITAEE